MRILMLAQWYAPTIGGEETHVRALSQALAAAGHQVAVAALAHPERAPLEMDGAVRVHSVEAGVQRLPFLFASTGRQSAPPAPDPVLARGLRRVVRLERPEVVHAHNWLVYSYLPVRRRSVPLVMTLHDHSHVCAKKNLMYRGAPCSGPGLRKCIGCAVAHYGAPKGLVTLGGLWGMQGSLRRAVARFITVSQAVAAGNGLVADGVRHEVIPNFLPDGFDAAGGTEGPKGLPETPYMLFVGSLSRSKGIPELLEAYGRLPDARPPLVLIGYRGSESLPELDRPPIGVRVLLDQPHTVALAAWQRALFGAVPSVCVEAFGMVALEAMAHGRPVVASRVGGLPEVVADGETGLLVEPGDAGGLARAMDTLTRDAALRERLGAAGRAVAERYRAAAVVPQIEAVYRREVERLRMGTQPASPRSERPSQ